MIKIVPYSPGHWEFFEMKPIFSAGIEKDTLDRVFYKTESPMVSLIRERRVIAFMGVCVITKGVGDVFSVTSPHVQYCPVEFHKATLGLIDKYQKKLELHRVQMTVDADYKEGLRWAEALGFKKEGLLVKYGPDKKDHYMMGRVH